MSWSRVSLGLHFGLSLDSIFATQPLPVDVVASTLTVMFGDGIPTRKRQKLRLAPRRVDSQKPATTPPTGSPLAPVEPGTRLTAAQRKAQVALAARQVFVERGLAMARTKEIADRAGITEAFMFRLFNGKEELYQTAIEDPAAELVRRWSYELGQIATRGDDPVTTLLAINEEGISILDELAPRVHDRRLLADGARKAVLPHGR